RSARHRAQRQSKRLGDARGWALCAAHARQRAGAQLSGHPHAARTRQPVTGSTPAHSPERRLMNQSLRMFIALAIIAGLGLILYKLLRFVQTKDQNQRAGLASLAQKRGWRYEDAPGKLIDFRLSGTTNGVSWQVVGKRDPGNENTTPST